MWRSPESLHCSNRRIEVSAAAFVLENLVRFRNVR